MVIPLLWAQLVRPYDAELEVLLPRFFARWVVWLFKELGGDSL